MEWEALKIVYGVQKFRNYLLASQFTFYVDHYALMYVVYKVQILCGPLCTDVQKHWRLSVNLKFSKRDVVGWRKELVLRSRMFKLINGLFYKMGCDQVLRRAKCPKGSPWRFNRGPYGTRHNNTKHSLDRAIEAYVVQWHQGVDGQLWRSAKCPKGSPWRFNRGPYGTRHNSTKHSLDRAIEAYVVQWHQGVDG